MLEIIVVFILIGFGVAFKRYKSTWLNYVSQSIPSDLSPNLPAKINMNALSGDVEEPFVIETVIEQLKARTLDCQQLNALLERCSKNNATDIVIIVLQQVLQVEFPIHQRAHLAMGELIVNVVPDAYTYSLAFKTIQTRFQEAREENYLDCNELGTIQATELLWRSVQKKKLENIVLLNQYVQILNQTSYFINAVKVYEIYLQQFVPDRVTASQLKKISYRLSKQLVHMVKQTNFDQAEFTKIQDLCSRVENLILSILTENSGSIKNVNSYEFAQHIDQYERIIRGILDSYSNRYNISAVSELLAAAQLKVPLCRVTVLQNTVQYLNLGLIYHNQCVLKILGTYAHKQNATLLIFVLKQLKSVLWDVAISDGLDYPSFDSSEKVLDLVRVYSDSLQILNRIGSHWGVIELFTKQLTTLPSVHVKYQSLSEADQGVPFPDVSVMCMVAKALIRERSTLVACKVIEFWQRNSDSVKGKQEINELQVDLHQLEKEPYFRVLDALRSTREHITVEVNTFLLNGVIIELNSTSQYQVAQDVFWWMCNNTPQHHRPNSSTYNMMLLVYGSMKEYTKAQKLFDSMVCQWNELNDDDTHIDLYDDICKNIRGKRSARSSSSGMSTGWTKKASAAKLLDSDTDDDHQLMAFPIPQVVNYDDVYSLKHSSDILMQKLGLDIPPANMNSLISMINLLSKQRLYDDIIELVERFEKILSKASHQLLTLDICAKDQLYCTLYKVLMQSSQEKFKIQAARYILESLEKSHIIQDKQLYRDCMQMIDTMNFEGKFELKQRLNELLQRKSVDLSDIPRPFRRQYSVDSGDDQSSQHNWGRRNSNLSYISDGNPIHNGEEDNQSTQRGYDASEEYSSSSLSKSKRNSALDLTRRQSTFTPKCLEAQPRKKSNIKMKKRYSDKGVEPIHEQKEDESPLQKRKIVPPVQVAFKLDDVGSPIKLIKVD